MELFGEITKLSYDCWCTISSASIIQPSTEIKAIHADRKFHKCEVKSLEFKETEVNYFPRGLNLIFPNLERLEISSCGLKKISREDLIGLEKLEALILDKNELMSLPDDLFVNMTKLREINFRSNKIKFMTSNLLRPILANGIEWINFSRNAKIDEFFHPDMKGSTKSLEHLMDIIDKQCRISEINEKSADCQVFNGEIFESHEKPENLELKLLTAHQKKSTEGARKFWLTGKFSDFVIIVESKEFQVHKTILAAQSEVFAQLFENNEDASEMKIEDLSEESVEEFLRYLYTGQLIFENNHVMEIFALATKLKVEEVRKATEKIIIRTLNDANSYKIFVFGHAYKSDEIIRAAFEQIRKMFPDRKFSDSLCGDPMKVKDLVVFKNKIDAKTKEFIKFEIGESSKL